MRMTRLASQDGAIAIMVAVLAMVMFAAAAFALDGGRLWMAKRNLVTATDGSALAAASAYAVGEDGCGLHAENYLGLNAPTATLEDCVFVPSATATTGYVTVQGEQSLPFIFGRFVGIPTASVESTTAVQIGFPQDLTGLRPIALCADDDQIENWNPDSSDIHQIPIDQTTGSNCPGAPGSFGWIDFDGSGLANLIAQGYGGTVTEEDPLGVDTGVVASQPVRTALDGLVGKTVLIVVFSQMDGQGSKAFYTVAGFAAMKVEGVNLTGNPKYISVSAAHMLGTGECCGPPPEVDLGVRAMNICAIDVASAAANCTN